MDKHSRFSITTSTLLWYASSTLAACLLVSADAAAALDFRLLANCNLMHHSVQTARARIDAKDGTCGRPGNRLEKRVMEIWRDRGMDACFVAPPFRTQEAFSCFYLLGGHELTCFRPTDAASIDDYQKHYHKRYAETLRDLLATAAACEHSNGDLAPAPKTLLPLPLAAFSRLEVGFAMPMGKGRLVPDRALHGFAKVDPSVPALGEAIEVFAVSFNGRVQAAPATATLGAGTVLVDNDKTMDEQFNRSLRNAKPRVRVASIEFELRRSGNHAPPALNDVISVIEGGFRNEGFRRLSDAQIKKYTGMRINQFFDEIRKSEPYGWKEIYAQREQRFTMWINEKQAHCTVEGKGAVGIGLHSRSPDPEVRSDGGAITAMVLSLGKCAEPEKANATYTEDLFQILKDAVVKERNN